MELEDYEKQLSEHPRDYFGEIDTWMDEGFSNAMFSHHRDSDVLDESNWDFVCKALEPYMGEDNVRMTSSNHWAVGWIETLHIRMRWEDDEFTPAFHAAVNLRERMENYPVLDEEDYSRRETEDLLEYLAQEVGEENVPALAEYLYEIYSVYRSEDVSYKWVEEWKEENLVQDC